MNEPYRLRYTNQIVGFFLLVILVVTMVASVVLFSRLFVTQDFYYATATEQEAKDLRTGTEVVILGRTIGEVTDLRYADEGGDVIVELGIDSDYRDQMTTNSVVTLDRRFGVGAPVLTIRRQKANVGPDQAMPLQPGDSLGDFGDVVEPIEEIASKVESTSDSVDSAAVSLRQSITESVNPTFAKGAQAFESWETTSETVRPEALKTLAQIRTSTSKIESDLSDLTARLNRLIAEEIRPSVARISGSAESASKAADGVRETAKVIEMQSVSTGEDVRETLASLRETAEQIKKLTLETREVVRIVRSEANELPGTTRRVNNTVSEAQDLVGDIQDHWLLRRSRSHRAPTQQLPPTSVRTGGFQ